MPPFLKKKPTGPEQKSFINPLHSDQYSTMPCLSEHMRSWKYTAAIVIVLLQFMLILPASATITAKCSWHETITKGDTVTLVGTESTNGTVVIWVIGRNYFDIKTVNPDKKGNFSFVVKPDETRKYSSGQYAVLIVDPGQNGAIEIEPLVWEEGIKIADRGKIVTDIGTKEALRAVVTPEVNAILNAAVRPGVDDIITPYYFYVEEPGVHFDAMSGTGSQSRLPNQTTGEKIVVTGTTNMGVENQLRVEIRDQTSNALITSGSVPVVDGTILNRWAYELAAPGLQKGDYFITVGSLKGSPTGTALLTIARQNSQPIPETGATHGLDSGFDIFIPLLISLGALGIIGVIIMVSIKK